MTAPEPIGPGICDGCGRDVAELRAFDAAQVACGICMCLDCVPADPPADRPMNSDEQRADRWARLAARPPSCADLDLEPIARPIRCQPRQLRDYIDQRVAELDAAPIDRVRECPLCHQLAQLDDQLVCPTCKRAADLRASGTQQALFTPLRPQITGQGDLF